MPNYKTCDSCGERYAARRATSRYCSDACRKRGQRSGPADPRGDLVGAVRGDLAAAGLLDTRVAQQAVALAAKVAGGHDTGASLAAASRELDRLLDKALVGVDAHGTPLDDLRQRRQHRATTGEGR